MKQNTHTHTCTCSCRKINFSPQQTYSKSETSDDSKLIPQAAEALKEEEREVHTASYVKYSEELDAATEEEYQVSVLLLKIEKQMASYHSVLPH